MADDAERQGRVSIGRTPYALQRSRTAAKSPEFRVVSWDVGHDLALMIVDERFDLGEALLVELAREDTGRLRVSVGHGGGTCLAR